MFLEWGIGLTDNDTFLMRPIAVDREDAYLMEIKQGMFWYNTELTKYSLREVGVRYKNKTDFYLYCSSTSIISDSLCSIEKP